MNPPSYETVQQGGAQPPHNTAMDTKATNGDQKPPPNQTEKSEESQESEHLEDDIKFGPDKVNVFCPTCGVNVDTRVKRDVTRRCQIFTGVTCLVGCLLSGLCCLGLVPCIVLGLKKHYCPQCNKQLGEYDPTLHICSE